MSDTFQFNRFCRLFVKHSNEHLNKYAMSLGVLIGVLVLGGSFLVYLADFPLDPGMLTGLFLVVLMIAGTIFTSNIFSDLGDRRKAIPWLTLPASHFEKFLVAWIYSFLLFTVVYLFIFSSLATLAMTLKPLQDNGSFSVFDSRIRDMYLVFAFLQSVALFGAVYFDKLHFIKTALAFFIFFFFMIVLNKVILGAMVGRHIDFSPPFGVLRFREGGQDFTVEPGISVSVLLVFVVLTFVFWTAAYFRLKEKQA